MNLWRELRRRRVLRTAGLYIVGAWVAIQVAGLFFPAWGIPDTALRFFILAAVACFPLALIFGWRYDITGKGLVRTPSLRVGETVDTSLTRTDFLILGALAAIALAVLYDSAGRIHDEIVDAPGITEILPNSIAILPFENLDAQEDTAYFSDGVTEEILHRLSTLGPLHVIGRTSSFAFRGAEEGPARIAELIGVRYLLHGSVRRDDEQVRVTARLTDENGYQVWSQSFDRRLEGIFTIQSEIASTVSSEVLNEIVPLSELPAGRTTDNMDAYNEYLVGRAHLTSRSAGWQYDAERAFRAAIDLDPSFAPPYAGLAVALFINRSEPGVNEAAQRAAERALELDPELAEGHAALGLILGELAIDEKQGIIHLQRAIELDPSLSDAYNWLAIAYLNQGQDELSQSIQLRGHEIDPLNPPLVTNIANRFARQGDFERAERMMQRLLFLPEPPGVALFELMALYTDWGKLDKAVRMAKDTLRAYGNTPQPNAFSAMAMVYNRLGLVADSVYWENVFLDHVEQPVGRFMFPTYLSRQRGDPARAGQLLDELAATGALDAVLREPSYGSAIVGVAHLFAERYERGIEIFESLFEGRLSKVLDYVDVSDAVDVAHALAIAYRATGRTDKERELLEEIAGWLDTDTSPETMTPEILERLTINRALRGDTQGAYEALRAAVDLGWRNYYWIVNGPVLAESMSDPQIQELLREVKQDVDRMRIAIEQEDAAHDFRAEIRALLAQ